MHNGWTAVPVAEMSTETLRFRAVILAMVARDHPDDADLIAANQDTRQELERRA